MIRHKTTLLIFAFFLGCGRLGEGQKFFADKDPIDNFHQGAKEESFTQETVEEMKKSPVDILFYIDSSSSMANEQAKLAKNLSAFINALTALSIDFKIGIITQDHSNALKIVEKELTSDHAQKDSAAFKHDFKAKVNVGIKGFWPEKPAQYIKDFFDVNTDWSTRDNPLAVIIVSDTIDFTVPVDFNIATYLKKLKTDPSLVKIFAIVNLVEEDPLTSKDWSTFHPRSRATIGRHVKAAKDTGGISSDINAPFNNILGKIGDKISKHTSTFFKVKRPLSPKDLKNIKIKVDGIEMARAGWTFNKENNSLSFNKGFAPPPKSKLEILFRKPASEFRLKRKLDGKHINTVDITVDGKSVPKEHWEYNEENNSIRFFEDHIPSIGSSIRVVYEDVF